MTLSWSGGTGAIANQDPTVTYVYEGQTHTVALSQTPQTYPVDVGTTITPQASWTSNAITFTPSPASVVAYSGLTEDFVYGTVAPKTCPQMGSNVTALFQSGQCFIPGVFWSFGNVLGAPVLVEFLTIIPGIVMYIKPRNGVLALIMMALIQGSITQLLGLSTSITETIIALTAVLTISAGLMKVLWGGMNNQ